MRQKRARAAPRNMRRHRSHAPCLEMKAATVQIDAVTVPSFVDSVRSTRCISAALIDVDEVVCTSCGNLHRRPAFHVEPSCTTIVIVLIGEQYNTL